MILVLMLGAVLLVVGAVGTWYAREASTVLRPLVMIVGWILCLGTLVALIL